MQAQQPVQSISQRESYQPTAFTKLLWWLATAEKEIVLDCAIDRNRYAIAGFTVLGTWVFATLAWTYFFSTVVSAWWIAIPLGIFMGGIILGIDRALIKGINAENKRKITPLLIRAALAITIGTFMAQPALLYLFNKEIQVQISLDNEQKKTNKIHLQDSLYAAQKSELTTQKNFLTQQLSVKYAEVAAARNNFIAETDGTGGSGKIGLKDIAKAKQDEYTKSSAQFQQLDLDMRPKLNSIDSSLAGIESLKKKEFTAFTALLNDGFLTRIEALHNLLQGNAAAQFRYYLLIVILVLIELMPVIAKTLLPNGSYDEKVKLREAMEKTIAGSNIEKEQALKELYNKAAYDQDSIFINAFFEKAKTLRAEKMIKKLQSWQQEEAQGFDAVWVDLKKNFLTKQEN